MLLRIVTPFYFNSQEEIKKLLESLKSNLKIPAEVIFWNNGGDLSFIRDLFYLHSDRFQIHMAGTGKNLGFSSAVNRAAELETHSGWTSLLCFNPDAQLLSVIDVTVYEKLLSLQGVVGFRVFNDPLKQKRQSSARYFPNLLTAVTGREGVLTQLFPNNRWSKKYLGQNLDSESVQRVDWVSGCALFCPRDVWQRLSGFDEAYFFAIEDVDLGRRAQKLKIPVYFVPWVDVFHSLGTSSKKKPIKSDYFHHLGMWIYHLKWSGPLGFLLGPFVFIGILLRFLFRRVVR